MDPELEVGVEDPTAPQFPGMTARRTKEGDLYYVPSGGPTTPEASFVPLDEGITVTAEPTAPTIEVPKPDVTAVEEAPGAGTVPEQLKKLGPSPVEELKALAANLPEVPPPVEETPPPDEEIPSEYPPEQRGFGEAAFAPVRMGVAEFLKHAPRAVYGIPAQLTGLLADIQEAQPAQVPRSARRVGGMMPKSESTLMRDVSDWLHGAEAGSKRLVGEVTDTTREPSTPLEKGAVWTGEYVQPMKPVSAVATTGLAIAGAAARGGLTNFSPADVPIPSLIREAKGAEDPLAKALGLPSAPTSQGFPGAPEVKSAPEPNAPVIKQPVVPGSKIVPATPREGTQPGTVIELRTGKGGIAKKGPVTIPEGVVIPPPDLRTTAKPNLKPYAGRLQKDGTRVGAETPEAFAQRVENAWIVKEKEARDYTPTAVETFRAVDSLQKAATPDYRAMEYGAVLLGAALATPYGIKAMRSVRIPATARIREIKGAAPGTQAITNPLDYARAVGDDVIAPLTNAARKQGLSPTVIDRLDNLFRIQSRNGGRALADGAIQTGRMETPVFRFRAPVALDDLARTATPQSERYLKILDTQDKLNKAASTATAMKTGTPTVTTINGMTIQDTIQAQKNLEAAFPELKAYGESNRKWNAALVKFRVSGEYGTITKTQAAEMMKSEKNRLGGSFEDGAMAGQSSIARKEMYRRVNNEAIGTYVDEMRKVNPNLFVKITEEEAQQYEKYLVKFQRRGDWEYYSTDPLIADIMKSDHYLDTATAATVIRGTREMLEATTTRALAPGFAVVNAIRSYWIAKFTTEQGLKAPSLFGTAMAIPQQLLPQMANVVAHGFERGSGGFMRKMLGDQYSDSLAKYLTSVYEQSVYHQLKTMGTHRGIYVETQERLKALQAGSQAMRAAAQTDPMLKGALATWDAYRSLLESIHNSVAFNHFRKNLGRMQGREAELALKTRRLTGDPRAGGEFLVREGLGFRGMRYEGGTAGQALAAALKYGYGVPMEVGRTFIPWWNATLQGAKRIGEAYLNNPLRFTRSVILYAAVPEAVSTFYTKSLGLDPNGRSYYDYKLFGRSKYNQQMNYYFPIPGRPAEQGIEIPGVHEINPFKRATEMALHHAMGTNLPEDSAMYLPPGPEVTARGPLRQDFWQAAHAFLDTAIIPPMPPIFAAAFGSQGMRSPQGIFGGDAYKVKGDPYNQNGGLPTSLELMARAIFGGAGEALSGFYVAAFNDRDSDIRGKVINGLKEAGAPFVRRTPILRDITDIKADRSNDTELASRVFENQKYINDLANFYRKDERGGDITNKPASKGGGIALTEQYGLKQLNTANPGLPLDAPTNPLYIEFMNEFYNRFMKESPNPVKGEDQGGVAFKSLWRNYGTAKRKLDELRNVNYGTYERWQRDMDPEARAEIEGAGVDPTNRQEVVNFYRRMQFDALRTIDYVRRSTEDSMSARATANARLANPNAPPVTIRLKDLKPYAGAPTGTPFMFPELLGAP